MPQIRKGRKVATVVPPGTPVLVTGTGHIIMRKMALAGTGIVSGAAGPSDFGPTLGAQAIRDGAGYRTGQVTIFSGSSPGSFTRIQPSMTQAQIQTAIDSDTTGKIWWEAGKYRGPWSVTDTAHFRLYTKANQEHRFQTGPLRTAADTAIIQGSTGMSSTTDWEAGTGADAGTWVAINQTQDFSSRHNIAGPDPYHNDYTPAGHNLEAYYRDGIQLIPALTKAAVVGRTDAVFFDGVANRAYLGSTPVGHTIERLEDFAFLFRIRQPNITFKGGIFQHSGFPMIHPEITGGNDCSGFTIQDSELAYGRINGCFNGGGNNPEYVDDITLSHCTIHHGGRYNFNMTWTTNSVIEYCELYAGNWLHFGNRAVGTFDEGSDKTLFTDGLRYHHNWVHDNDGAAVWPDTQNNGWVFDENVVENNFGPGIHNEQNSGSTIHHNHFANNQRDGNQPAPFDGTAVGWPTIGGWSYKGGGIRVSVTENCEIYSNEFVQNKHATLWVNHQIGRAFRVENLYFHDNLVYHSDGDSAQEHMITYRDTSEDFVYTTAANNRFNFNEYHVPSVGRGGPTAEVGEQTWFFAPSGTYRTFAEWKAGLSPQVAGGAGPAFHDPNSTLETDL